ncbi:MAG: CheR family methyltransferase, partial [Candidatus Sulfotelmatobacter sp.]
MSSAGDEMGVASRRAGWLHAAVDTVSRSRRLRKYLGRPYLRGNIWLWNHLPASLTSSRLGSLYGAHVHRLIQLRSARRQYTGTFFFRNRPEIELLIRLLDRIGSSTVDLTILGCSKGAEVYSFSYSIRSARPKLGVRIRAVDIDADVVEFAEGGVYYLGNRAGGRDSGLDTLSPLGELAAKTSGDQNTSVFERMSADEMAAMFECEVGRARVRQQFREDIAWSVGDAGDSKLIDEFGLQDVVVANRFLCHMQPGEAESCLRQLARLVKPGGYLFVSGVDLDVRTKVARELGWRPVTELIDEIHEGDQSLRKDWPLQYWGLEALDRRRSDSDLRYASVFRVGQASSANAPGK